MNYSLSPELNERYEPLDIMGHGAFATVIKARARRSGQFVAIKHFQHPNGQRHSFFRELQLTIQLRHPNIVRCIDLFSADEKSSDLILEFADRGNLRAQIVPENPLKIQQVIPILLHITSGLEYAHSENIIHRDLKPENILIFATYLGNIYKIADFGIAKFVGKAGKTLTNIGSPVYMAPEQFYDRYDLKTDIYALGIMFYELLHGELPFQGSHAEIFKGHLEKTAPIAPHIPSEIQQLLQKMLAKRPEARPHAADVRATLHSLALAYDLTVSLPKSEEDNQLVTHPQQQSGEFVFADLFDDVPPAVLDSTTSPGTSVNVNNTPSLATVSTPETTVASTSRETPKTPTHMTPPMQADSLFDEGFDAAEPVHDDMPFRLSGQPFEAAIHFGRLQITPQWSRATDTKSLYLVNLNDDDALLVVTQNGVYELNAQAGKGMMLYRGDIQSMGIPSRGLLPIRSGQDVIVLQREQAETHLWTMQEPVEQLCFAPDLQGVAAVMQQTIYYHDHQGDLLWSGQFSHPASEIYMAFEDHGQLMVAAYDSDNQGVYFYSRDGRVLCQYWLPGRIVAAARCYYDSGAWVVITTDNGAQALRISQQGLIGKPYDMERPLRRLVGTSRWLCGVDETGTLRMLDPTTGRIAPIPLPGTPLNYCPSSDEGGLYILEGRSEVLRYISVFAIEQVID